MSTTTRCRGDEELCVAASPTERSNLCQLFERRRYVSVCSLSRMSEASDASLEDDLTRSDDLDTSDLSPWYGFSFVDLYLLDEMN